MQQKTKEYRASRCRIFPPRIYRLSLGNIAAFVDGTAACSRHKTTPISAAELARSSNPLSSLLCHTTGRPAGRPGADQHLRVAFSLAERNNALRLVPPVLKQNPFFSLLPLLPSRGSTSLSEGRVSCATM